MVVEHLPLVLEEWEMLGSTVWWRRFSCFEPWNVRWKWKSLHHKNMEAYQIPSYSGHTVDPEILAVKIFSQLLQNTKIFLAIHVYTTVTCIYSSYNKLSSSENFHKHFSSQNNFYSKNFCRELYLMRKSPNLLYICTTCAFAWHLLKFLQLVNRT